MLTIACDAYDVAAKEHVSHKRVLKGLSEEVKKLEAEAKVLDDQIKQLQNKWRLKRKAYGDAKMARNDFSIKLTAAARSVADVKAAWDAFQAAWGKMSKTQEKRLTVAQLKYHRSARKRAKEILRDA
jgi:chromosome segregation ATPase